MSCQQIPFIEDGPNVKYSGDNCNLIKKTTTGKTVEMKGVSVCESVAEEGEPLVKCYNEPQSLVSEVNDTHQIQACDCKSEILPDPKTGGAKKRKSVKKKKMKKSKKQRKSRKKH
jgi:hypothetical protein